MNIFEVALSNAPRNVSHHDQLHLPSSLDDNNLKLPEYNVMMELSVDRVITQGSTSIEFSANAIAYLPQTPTTVCVCVCIHWLLLFLPIIAARCCNWRYSLGCQHVLQ